MPLTHIQINALRSKSKPTRGRPKTDATAFSARLTEACEADPDCPEEGKGRYRYLADGCAEVTVNGKTQRVTLATAGKWLNARTIPTPPKMEALAELLGTTVDYLAYGKGSLRPDKNALIQSARAEAHVNLVIAFLREDNLPVGILGETDPWREFCAAADYDICDTDLHPCGFGGV